MKKLILALLCVLLTAGFAFAVDVDLKGMYNVRGQYFDNDTGLYAQDSNGDKTATYFAFDHELDATARLLVTDKTRVIVNFEIRDETWLIGNTDNNTNSGFGTTKGLDDNIHFKRVYGSHTFDYGGVLDVGLMTGGAWMTGFGDNGNGRYRVKYTQPTQIGPVIAIYEKNNELGSGSLKNSEKDDGTAYYLASVMKFGDFNLYPLLGYADASNLVLDQGSDGVQQILFFLGADATFGDFGFEAEFNYIDVDQSDLNLEDYGKWGIYGNGWWNVGAGKVGLLAAYGSWDNDAGKGFGFGEDFTPTVFGADQAAIGGDGSTYPNSGGAGISEYRAVAMIQLYGSLAISEQFSINGAALYWSSTSDENANGSNNFWKDANGYEINAGLSYKITDAVTYSIASGFGKISLDSDAGKATNPGGAPDGFIRAYHKFQIDF